MNIKHKEIIILPLKPIINLKFLLTYNTEIFGILTCIWDDVCTTFRADTIASLTMSLVIACREVEGPARLDGPAERDVIDSLASTPKTNNYYYYK